MVNTDALHILISEHTMQRYAQHTIIGILQNIPIRYEPCVVYLTPFGMNFILSL